MTACLGEITFRRRNTGGLFKELHEEIILKPKETALLLIPSFLYLVQNNLLFLAVTPPLAALRCTASVLSSVRHRIPISSRRILLSLPGRCAALSPHKDATNHMFLCSSAQHETHICEARLRTWSRRCTRSGFLLVYVPATPCPVLATPCAVLTL